MAQQQTTVIALVKFRRDCLHWGIPQLALRKYFVPEVPGLIFFKVLGSGYNGGFGMLPGLNYQGLCFHFDEEENAQNFLNHSDLLKQYELRSDEFFVSVLVPYDSRGSWSGEKITVHEKAKNFELNKEPIASLTRASIRIRKMISFWSHTPETEGCIIRYTRLYVICRIRRGSATSSSNIHNLGKFTEFGVVFKKRRAFRCIEEGLPGKLF